MLDDTQSRSLIGPVTSTSRSKGSPAERDILRVRAEGDDDRKAARFDGTEDVADDGAAVAKLDGNILLDEESMKHGSLPAFDLEEAGMMRPGQVRVKPGALEPVSSAPHFL